MTIATVSPSSDLVKLGRGILLFDRYASDGSRTGFVPLGNCEDFSIGVSGETLDLKDNTQQTSAPYKSVNISTDTPISITVFEFSKFSMALAYMGDTTTYTQSASTATAEVLAASTVTDLKGKWFKTVKRNISSVVVKQGATTFVLGTDYTLDTVRGIVKVMTTGGITDGVALTVDYSYAAMTGANALAVVRGATVSLIEGYLMFIANNSTGPNDDCDVYRASLTPNGQTGFIADEFGKWTLQGKAQSDAAGQYGGSASDPYFRITRQF